MDRARFPEGVREAAGQLDPAALSRALEALRAALPRVRDAATAHAAHDALLFAIAHPPDASCRELAERTLAELLDRVAATPRLAARLANSGVAGTTIEGTFSLPIVRWLVARHPGRVAYDSAEPQEDAAALFVRAALLPPERERLERGTPSLDRWLAAQSRDAGVRLKLLVGAIDRLPGDDPTREMLFAALRPFVRWALDRSGTSLSTARSLPREPHYVTAWERKAVLDEVVCRPLPRPERLNEAKRTRLLDTSRGVLACLLRETDPLSYGEPDGVALFRLERGVDVALFTMRAEYRLALESYVGYMAFKNGVPAAYGGAWMFGRRCKIGINVFPFMRGGESAPLLAQLMRVYAHHYRPTVFFVEPYQIGHGNADGIRSGAFWFYYRLGFRPVQPDLAALAQDEFARLAQAGRSSAAVLRRLSGADLRWEQPGARAGAMPDPYTLNAVLSDRLRTAFAGDREAAVAASRRCVLALFRGLVSDRDQRAIGAAWGPLLELLPVLATWPAAARKKLAAMFVAKLRGDERNYALALAENERFLGELERLCRTKP